MSRNRPYRTWFDKPACRLKFMHDLRGVEGLNQIVDKRWPGSFSFAFLLTIKGLPPRGVRVTFTKGSPEHPKVYVDGPADSPHRYPDGHLCMWFPWDPPANRWTLSDGAPVLLADIAVHLIREEWYRKTGEWPGQEVDHGQEDPSMDESRAEARSAS